MPRGRVPRVFKEQVQPNSSLCIGAKLQKAGVKDQSLNVDSDRNV
jgi:hypothetical protein